MEQRGADRRCGLRRSREGGGDRPPKQRRPAGQIAGQRRPAGPRRRLRQRQGPAAACRSAGGSSAASATTTASAATPRASPSPPAPGGQVSSPTDGWVVYAGPFRSYGQLLIINAGGRISCAAGGHGTNRCATRPVRACRRAGCRDGRTEAGEHRRRGRRCRPAGALYRIPERRDFDRPGPLVGRVQ